MASAQYAKKSLSEEERWLYIALYSKGQNNKHCEPIIEQNADLMLYEVFMITIPKYGSDLGLFAKFADTYSRLISDGISSGDIRRNEGKIWLTDKSIADAKKEWEALERSKESLVYFGKRTYNRATRDEAKCCLYCEWPDLAKEAGEYEWFEKNRKDLAFAFYKRKEISISGAAPIAGISYRDFMIEMGKRGISMTE